MMKKKIALLILTGACLFNTVPCFASQSTKISVSTSKGAQYTILPDAETLQKDVGFKPKAPSTLAGGYQFEEGRITELFDTDANGNETNSRKGISFKYKKNVNGSSKSVTLSADTASGQSAPEKSTPIKYGEITLYYSDVQASSVLWMDGDVCYILMDINKMVSKDELVAMSKGMIDLDAASAATK